MATARACPGGAMFGNQTARSRERRVAERERDADPVQHLNILHH